ncbi:MAG: penicillin acylase family protein, partial [Saprospiraceae bacterium]|nr:penicillin acylase family protein [Saprospiraceae bacterium]
RAGNIGWQAVGIAPIRRNWSGLVPVPGDGRYEWDGYLPIVEKPHIYNPPGGLFITANENVTPPDYAHWDAIGYSWSDPFRGDRLAELLNDGRKHTMHDMAEYQTDYLSIPARMLVPLLRHIDADDPRVDSLRQVLLRWDFILDANSVEAGVYVAWERELSSRLESLYVPEKSRDLYSPQMTRVIHWLLYPDGAFGTDPVDGRDQLLLEALTSAIEWMQERLGGDPQHWQYGQQDYKHVVIRHPLSRAVNDSLRQLLDVGIASRGGNGYTVGSTSNSLNQSSGASFRIIVDTGNWDHCLAMNSPGQAGDPSHPHYRNLFELWAGDRFFPLFFSRERIISVTDRRIMLQPRR